MSGVHQQADALVERPIASEQAIGLHQHIRPSLRPNATADCRISSRSSALQRQSTGETEALHSDRILINEFLKTLC